jgi:hypothetical protein
MAKAKNTDFDEFVKRQQPRSEAERVDWNKRRDEWLGHLKQLYAEVEAFLKEYVDNGSIILERKKHRIIEENIGAYDSEIMIIRIGRQEIALRPVGTFLIGSRGRVDVEGSADRAKLVLVDKDATSMRSAIKIRILVPGEPHPPAEKAPKDIDWTWRIVTSPPEVAFKELNKESFFQILMAVSNAR